MKHVLKCCNKCQNSKTPDEKKLNVSLVPNIKFHAFVNISKCSIYDKKLQIKEESVKSLVNNKMNYIEASFHQERTCFA